MFCLLILTGTKLWLKFAAPDISQGKTRNTAKIAQPGLLLPVSDRTSTSLVGSTEVRGHADAFAGPLGSVNKKVLFISPPRGSASFQATPACYSLEPTPAKVRLVEPGSDRQ